MEPRKTQTREGSTMVNGRDAALPRLKAKEVHSQ